MHALDKVERGGMRRVRSEQPWQQRRRRAVRTAWIVAAVAAAIYLLAVLQSFGVIRSGG
jgi:hypothetical protein